MTLPSVVRLSLVRTNAGPLPGLTCWNSTILKIVPSTSMWVPFLNWFVLIIRDQVSHARRRPRSAAARSAGPSHRVVLDVVDREAGRLQVVERRAVAVAAVADPELQRL